MKIRYKYILLIIGLIAFSSCTNKTKVIESKEENVFPLCFINRPLMDSYYDIGDIIQIEVTAYDEDGELTNVQIYVNDDLLFEDNEEPYRYTWDSSNEPNGIKNIYAKATDDSNAVSIDTVTITLGWIYNIPEQTNDGWETTSVNDVGINVDVMTDMMNYIKENPGHNIHDILIFKENKLVFEEYFDGYLYAWDPPFRGDYITFDKDVDHYLASVTKSITSVLFGIAVKEGFITNLDMKLYDIFPNYQYLLTGQKAEITIRHLLTMSSGLAWDESSPYPNNDSINLVNFATDLLEYTFSLPLIYTPGTEFHYNSGTTNVLGAIIEKYTNMSLLEFANTYLFEPLNIENVSWHKIRSGYYFASGGLFLKPRDLAKIGYMFLNNGTWNTENIITEDWINESISNQINTQGRTLAWADSYGYQWWREIFVAYGHSFNSFFASGWGDQWMFIFPEDDMIVVMNGGTYVDRPFDPIGLVQYMILYSIIDN